MQKRLIKLIAYFIARYYLSRPDLTDLVAIKFHDFPTLFKAILNEICYILRLSISYKLISVNTELTNACNLHCRICPVGNGRMKREKTFMKPELFKKTINENPEIDSILIFQWGESLLHEDTIDLIQYAAQRGIRVFLTTNGTLLDSELSRRIIESGLERLTFSVDGVGDKYTNIRGFRYEELKHKIIEFKNIRDQMKSNLKIDISMVVFKETKGEIERYRKEWEDIADRTQLIPMFVSLERKRRCRELWRGTLTVLADGRVVPCCADYEGVNVVGDVSTQKLTDIWGGEKIRNLRKDHIKNRFKGICRNCGEFENPFVSKRFD